MTVGNNRRGSIWRREARWHFWKIEMFQVGGRSIEEEGNVIRERDETGALKARGGEIHEGFRVFSLKGSHNGGPMRFNWGRK